jgi:hypothetical protein
MVGKSKLLRESSDGLFLCLRTPIPEGSEQVICLFEEPCAHLDPSLPLFKDETRQVVLDDGRETQGSRMNPA